MPKWVSTLPVVAGFFALVGLAFLPRNLEVDVILTDNSTSTFGARGDHSAPAPIADPED